MMWKHTSAIALAAVVAAVAISLLFIFKPEYLNTDTAQYVVTARHLLRGEGLSTSLIYFEQQMVSGDVPAPQTVWPPGYPALIAIAMALGVPFAQAPFLLALLAHAATSIVLYSLLRRLDCNPWVAAGGAVICMIAVLCNVLVLRGLSESTYALSTVLCAWAIARSDTPNQTRWLFAAGLTAAVAFSMRYAGIAFVAAFGAVLGVRWLIDRSAKTFWQGAIAIFVPAAFIGVLFARNLRLVGSFTGGPSVEYGSSASDVARSIVWSFEQLASIFDGFGRVVGIVIVLILSWMVLQSLRYLRASPPRMASAAGSVLVLSYTYVLLTVLMYGYLAYKRTPEMFTPRYILPLLPFVIVIGAVLVSSLLARVRDQPFMHQLVRNGAIAVLVSFVALQVHATGLWRNWIRGDGKFSEIIHAMDEQHQGQTLRKIIGEQAGNGALLAVDGQLLGMWLDLPTVGLSEAAWTSKTWTDEEVHRLVRRFGVRVICEFPRTYNPSAQVNRHRVFFNDLKEGRVPSWLTLVAETPSARVYAVKAGE